MKLTSLGEVRTVTGSKYLIERGARSVFVDCGLLQGFKQLRLRNRQPLPVHPASIYAVILNLCRHPDTRSPDYSRYLPLLVHNGFKSLVVAHVLL